MRRSVRVSIAIMGAMVFALVLSLASQAFGYREPNAFTSSGCSYCHAAGDTYRLSSGACVDCHATPDVGSGVAGFEFGEWYGPHGGYATTTAKCRVCHSVHRAPAGGILLLPAATVTGTCFTCHDGTGGFGVYGTILARTGIDPQDRNAATAGASHRMVDATSTIPGGNSTSGGTAVGAFSGPNNVLACNDCHAVHGARTVAAFKGDRRRVRGLVPAPTTDKLLKDRPTGATSTVSVYGSDWCLGCHAGRASGGMVYNHPVDSGAAAFTYSNVAILTTVTPTGSTALGPLGGIPFLAASQSHLASETANSGNRGFLMPFPRTAQQGTHKPICQQCHEDSRSVGSLDATGTIGDATTASVTSADALYWNGSAWVASAGDNPRFQNFPHETANTYMLVENNDDLCMNCHPQGQLP